MDYIYLIKNLKTNKVYIGRTKNIYYRMQSHMNALAAGNHQCESLQKDHTPDTVYSVNILDVEPNLGRTEHREYDWMMRFRSYDPQYGYNDKDRPERFNWDSKFEKRPEVYRGKAQDWSKNSPSTDYGLGWIGKKKPEKVVVSGTKIEQIAQTLGVSVEELLKADEKEETNEICS